MTAPLIGINCDVTFTHPDVNGGEPYPFILAIDPSVRGGSVSVQRMVEETDSSVSIRLSLTVLLADDLKNPDGSEHTQGRSVSYSKLIDYLGKTDGLTINTVIGAFTGLAPLGFSATELHQPNRSHIACQFDNISAYHPPITAPNFWLSTWDNIDLDWSTSYWR